GETNAIEGMREASAADDVGGAPWHLSAQEVCRGQRRGMEGGLLHRDPHLFELVFKVARSPLAIVGQEQERMPRCLEPLYKIERARDQLAPMVDDSIHVAHITHHCFLQIKPVSTVPTASLPAKYSSTR